MDEQAAIVIEFGAKCIPNAFNNFRVATAFPVCLLNVLGGDVREAMDFNAAPVGDTEEVQCGMIRGMVRINLHLGRLTDSTSDAMSNEDIRDVQDYKLKTTQPS